MCRLAGGWLEWKTDQGQTLDGAKADLEQLLGRGVDLVEPGAVRNPLVLASINRNRETV